VLQNDDDDDVVVPTCLTLSQLVKAYTYLYFQGVMQKPFIDLTLLCIQN
jgi:hypothetical protein